MTVYANSRLILHKGAGNVHTCAIPDVCKTPSPGGPVPIPYVNVAKDGDLAKGAKKVKIGGKPVAIKSSNLSTSVGDEPGTAGGGVVSSKTKGKLTWTAVSSDVKAEGKGVCRFGDPTMHNGNTGNSAFIASGMTCMAYADDFEGDCRLCGEPAGAHRVHESPDSKALMADLREALIAQLEDPARVREYWQTREVLELLTTRQTDIQRALTRLQSGPGIVQQVVGFVLATQIARLTQQMATLTAEVAATEATLNGIVRGGAGHHQVLKKKKKGYMMGIMICRDHEGDAVYAAMSGQKATPGFRKVVNNDLGWILCDSSCLPVTDDLAAAHVAHRGAVAEQMVRDRYTHARNQRTTPPPGAHPSESWNEPGVCAAPKLLAHSGGHKPLYMTEEFFSPLKEQRVSLTYFRKDADLKARLKLALHSLTYGSIRFRAPQRVRHGDKEPGEFGHQDTVPSCNTCQAVVPFLSCDNQEPCSSGAAPAAPDPI